MRILVCPDKFAGTLSAIEAADALAEGWLAGAPADTVERRPLADGGPGFVAVLATAWGVEPRPVPATDPLGRPVTGAVLVHHGTGYVESAQACGLHLLAPDERDPLVATSFGLGALVMAAIEGGVREVVVGLGGSATNDGGAGLLAALGAPPLDADGAALPPGGAALLNCTRLGGADLGGAGLGDARPRGLPGLAGVRLVAATDVDSPLTGLFGASAVFGPQKGASPADVLRLDAALERYASVLERDLPGCPPGLAAVPGAGAAGGLGAALLALGGRVESGIGLVRRLTGLDEVLAGCDLVLTGEGSFDEQSLRGKVVAGCAGAARDLGLPCLVFAGRVTAGRRGAMAAGVTATYSLVEHYGSTERAMAEPAAGLRELAARAAQQWSRG